MKLVNMKDLMEDNMEIREAINGDYESADEVYVESNELHYHMKPNRIKSPRLSRPKEEFINRINGSAGNATILVAVEGDKVIGFADLVAKVDPENYYVNQKVYVKVDDLAVRKSHQGQGVGKAIMKAAENWAKARGINTIELSARWANKKALEFYDKVGYDIVSVNLRKEI
jgi:GNAT superfamily N-acetyltransferase